MSRVEEQRLALLGGDPVRTRPWPTYDKGDVLIDEDDVKAAGRAVKSKLLFRYDRRSLPDTEVGRFEQRLCEYFRVRHALAVSSGSAALSLGLMALGIGRGDEVLCSAFGFPASPSSVMLTGAHPALVDLDDDLHISLADLQRKLSHRTKAILMVHMRGQAGDVEAVLETAREWGIPLIEDAVPVLGVRYGRRHLGTFGAVGAFSTQSDKSLNTGEGGFLLTDDTAVFERAAVLSGAYEGRLGKHCVGWTPSENELRLPLFNFRMDEVRGAIACAQLAKLPGRLELLQRQYEMVAGMLSRYPEIVVRRSHASEATLGDTILFRLHDGDADEAYWFARALRAEGIEARSFGPRGGDNVRAFWTWEFMFPGRSRDEIRGLLPAATRLLDTTIDIPLSPTLGEPDLNDLAHAVAKVMRRRGTLKSAGSLVDGEGSSVDAGPTASAPRARAVRSVPCEAGSRAAPAEMTMQTTTNLTGLDHPNLLIVGFVKCGTTSLAKYLSHHPDVAVPVAKELYVLLDPGSPFQSMQPVIDGLAFGAGPRPAGKRYIDYVPRVGACRYALDATPYYYAQEAAVRYTEDHDDVRIIFMTREPASRLLSSYRFFKEMYQEYADGTFEEFVEALLSGDGRHDAYRQRIRKEFFRRSFDIELDMGCYAEHITGWIRRVERDRILVGSMEELRDRPWAFMARVCEFLQVEAGVYRDFAFQPYMQSYEVRIPLLQKLGRRLAREDPMRYDRIARYQSPFHRIPTGALRRLLDGAYKRLQHRGRDDRHYQAAMAALRAYYLPHNLTLRTGYGIDYVGSAEGS